MHRLLARKMAVAMKDSLGAIGDRHIAVDFSLRQFVEIADPLGDFDVSGFDLSRRIIGHAVEDDQPGYLFRKHAGIDQANHPSHGMADDRHVLEACSPYQGRQIVDMISQAVAAPGRPLRSAMPAKVGRHDMKVAPQRARQMIPAAGMIETAMNQEQRRGLRVTPVVEMKP